MEVVELSESVVRGARFFGAVNGGVLDRPNVTVRADDGRNHLLLSRRRYDVIMADAIHPQRAGSATLNSLEYFRLARAALAENGLMIQWIDNRLPEARYKLLLRTLLAAFPHVTAWADGELFMAGRGPPALDSAVLERRLAGVPPESLAASGLDSPEAVRSLFLAGDEALRAHVGEGADVTDDRPAIEYFRLLPADPRPPDLSALRLSRR